MNGGYSITEAIRREFKWRNEGRLITGWTIGRLTGDRDDRRLMSRESYRKGGKQFLHTTYGEIWLTYMMVRCNHGETCG